MKKAKGAALILMLAIALMLSSCQLALEEQTVSYDRLAGVSVRLNNANYYSREEYFDRSQPHEPDGAVVRLNFWDSETGEPMINVEYDEDWFEPAHLSSHVRDDVEEEYSIETTLYLVEEMLPAQPLLEMERVYQREDGTLYALDGGHSYSGSLDGLGLKISESYTQTDADGKKKALTSTIKLNVRYEEHVVSAEAIEMAGTSMELARHALTGQEEIWISPEAEWMLIEETLADGSVRRSAVNGPLNKETFFVRIANEQGVCIRHTYTLRVPGALSDKNEPA